MNNMGNNKFEEIAVELVRQAVDSSRKGDPEIENYDVYIVWLCKTLQNNKALLSTTLSDGKYYEVTFNGDKNEAYVDTYVKLKNEKYVM